MSPILEDGLPGRGRTDTWLITMVIVFVPKTWGCGVSLPNGRTHYMADINGGVIRSPLNHPSWDDPPPRWWAEFLRNGFLWIRVCIAGRAPEVQLLPGFSLRNALLRRVGGIPLGGRDP